MYHRPRTSPSRTAAPLGRSSRRSPANHPRRARTRIHRHHPSRRPTWSRGSRPRRRGPSPQCSGAPVQSHATPTPVRHAPAAPWRSGPISGATVVSKMMSPAGAGCEQKGAAGRRLESCPADLHAPGRFTRTGPDLHAPGSSLRSQVYASGSGGPLLRCALHPKSTCALLPASRLLALAHSRGKMQNEGLHYSTVAETAAVKALR
eukprot:COSAG06_NODE_15516_length_1065_cov_1.183230_1_plen_205_part_00